MNPPSSVVPGSITRREAVQRITLLLGGAISMPAMAALAAGCSRTRGEPLLVLSPDQRETLLALAEQIIPATDTPGAREAGVDGFVDAMLAEYYTAPERDAFLAGLDGVDARAQREHGVPFIDCTPEQRLALTTEFDAEAFAAGSAPPAEPPAVDVRERTDAPAAGVTLPLETSPATTRWVGVERDPDPRPAVPFFRTLKELTVIGYYTSEVGATQELRYEASPGRYQGCIPFDEIGRVWAV